VASRFPAETAERRDRVTELVKAGLGKPLETSEHLLREWFLMPGSTQYPELFRSLLARAEEPVALSLVLTALQTPHWRHSVLGREAIFRLLGSRAEQFQGQPIEVVLASKVLRPEDAWGAGWFGDAVLRITMLHASGAEHTLMNDVFLAPGFTTAPNAGDVMKTFVELSWKRIEAARALSDSEAWTRHPEAISLAVALARELDALDPLYRSALWRRLFVSNGANVQSLRRLQRSLVALGAHRSRQNGVFLPSDCARELAESYGVKN
jgi:hypothetical protein